MEKIVSDFFKDYEKNHNDKNSAKILYEKYKDFFSAREIIALMIVSSAIMNGDTDDTALEGKIDDIVDFSISLKNSSYEYEFQFNLYANKINIY